MSDKAFVDTNILLYAYDRSAGPKHERAKALVEGLWANRAGVLSTQVLQELCVNLRRKTAHPPSVKETRELLEDYSSWEVITNMPGAAVAALDLEVRYQISFWDALILHAAQVAGTAILYSEDFSEGQTYGSVRVINPLNEASDREG